MRIIVNVRQDTAGLCNGSTADSDSVCEGSNPSPAAKRLESIDSGLFFFPVSVLGIRPSHLFNKARSARSRRKAVFEGSNPSPAAKETCIVDAGLFSFLQLKIGHS